MATAETPPPPGPPFGQKPVGDQHFISGSLPLEKRGGLSVLGHPVDIYSTVLYLLVEGAMNVVPGVTPLSPTPSLSSPPSLTPHSLSLHIPLLSRHRLPSLKLFFYCDGLQNLSAMSNPHHFTGF